LSLVCLSSFFWSPLVASFLPVYPSLFSSVFTSSALYPGPPRSFLADYPSPLLAKPLRPFTSLTSPPVSLFPQGPCRFPLGARGCLIVLSVFFEEPSATFLLYGLFGTFLRSVSLHTISNPTTLPLVVSSSVYGFFFPTPPAMDSSFFFSRLFLFSVVVLA